MVKESCIRMKRISFTMCALALPVMFLTGSTAANEMRWAIGVSYISGFGDLVDQYEDNLDAEGYWTFTAENIPIGISLHPYYQWDEGLRIGGGIGPAMLIYGDRDHFQLPLSLTVGYTLGPNEPVSPYVFVGPSYHVASGDYYEGTNFGFVGGVGVEFLKRDSFALGLQATYDSAEVEIEDKLRGGINKIKAAEFAVSLLFRFK